MYKDGKPSQESIWQASPSLEEQSGKAEFPLLRDMLP
jgi:hypothetical protein